MPPEAAPETPPPTTASPGSLGSDGSAILLGSVFLVAVCSLVYELVAGAVASYLLGGSITQFSIVIGVFLSAMGLGSWLSQFVEHDLMARFIAVEVATGVVGGFSALLLFVAFTFTDVFYVALALVTGGVGTLIGLEIPLIIRILREREGSLRLTVAHVMTADYVGALAASLAFPFILVPHVGLMRASFLTGLLNLAVGWLCLVRFAGEAGTHLTRLRTAALAGTLLVAAGAVGSTALVELLEDRLYPDEIVYARQTPYQRIILTRWREDVRLFLDGKLQFSTVDEYRYHEPLVHPAMTSAARVERVLVLGGGDGMAVREILKYPGVRSVVLVDIDPEMTRIFRDHPVLSPLNGGSLADPRVSVVNEDAMRFLETTDRIFDVALVDLPDPSNLALGKLYTLSFFQLLARRLDPDGVFAVQASSPFFSPDAFWCVATTVEAVAVPGQGPEARLHASPYAANVPSFGEWGWVLAGARPLQLLRRPLAAPTRFLDEATLRGLFVLPKDLGRRQTEVNRLDNQVLVRYYDEGYREFYD